MKRIINTRVIAIILICLITAISLCGCKKTDSSDNDSKPASTVSDTETKVENSSEEESSLISSTDSNTESSQKDSASSEDKPNKAPEASVPSISSPSADPSDTPVASTKPITAEMVIMGKWRGSVDMAPMLIEIGYEIEGEQLVFCDVEFASGGVINEVIDRASLKNICTNVAKKALADEMEKANITKEQLETDKGMTYEEYLNEAVQTAMEYVPETIVSAYKFEGDVLYIREQEDTDFKKQEYSFDGNDKLTMVEDGVSITYTRIG